MMLKIFSQIKIISFDLKVFKSVISEDSKGKPIRANKNPCLIKCKMLDKN